MTFTDYKMMKGYSEDNFSDEKIESEILRYSEEFNKLLTKFNDYQSNIDILDSNINIFKDIKRKRYLQKLEKEFVLNKYHLEALKTIYLKYDDGCGFVRYYYKFEEFCKLKGFSKNELSANKEAELYIEFNKLLDEMPFAINYLANRHNNTGLKDKNKKNIYVGAVIEYTQHKAYNLGGFKAKVVFDNENACFGFIKENPLFEGFINSFAEIDELQTDFLDYCEVIGNINKNPELLKK